MDLGEHPWLATEFRRGSPFYPIISTPVNLKKFDGKRVRLAARARGYIFVRERDAEYMLGLHLILEPTQLQQ